jgi:hypothetical protein
MVLSQEFEHNHMTGFHYVFIDYIDSVNYYPLFSLHVLIILYCSVSLYFLSYLSHSIQGPTEGYTTYTE